MNIKRLFVLFAFVFFMGLNSCTKKISTESVDDYSLQEDIPLHKMIALGNKVLVVGGDKYTSSFIGAFSQGQLTKMTLPSTGLQTSLHDIAVNSAGNLFTVSNSAGMFFSYDSGVSWQFNQSNIWKEMKGVSFVGNDSVCIVGKGDTKYGFIARGDQQGIGMNAASASYNFELDEVRSTPLGTLYACGYGAILKSTDKGLHWDFTDAKNDWFRSMYWRNDNEGWAIGYEGTIIKTSDGGNHWEFLRRANNSFLKRLRMLGIHGYGSALAIVGEKGLLLLSYDDGAHWKTVETFTKEDLHAVLFESEKTLFVCGTKGAFFQVKLP